jgi:pantoate--beta-alanine ligase
MDVVKTVEEVRRRIAAARAAGRTVGLVPTMGNLHEGHLRLLDAAKGACSFAAVSLFVNPTQFGPGEDFARYPRTLEADLAACQARGADLVFCPEAAEMYRPDCRTEVRVRGLGEVLCGASRSGHFAGVATVVAKLLNIFQPDAAFFGAKDFQQTVIIRRMVEDLDIPARIVVCPTVREADGLAMSSRNAYLSAEERRQAPALYESLRRAQESLRRGPATAGEVAAAIREVLSAGAPSGIVDYVKVVDPWSLADVEVARPPVLVAVAVKFGRTRLIDNVLVDGGDRPIRSC